MQKNFKNLTGRFFTKVENPGPNLFPKTQELARNHSFCTYAKSSEKLIFLAPYYAHVYFFGKLCVSTK